MTEPENLWGPIPTETKLRPPIAVLREQATILTQATGGLLVGEVVPSQRNSLALGSSLDIVASVLNSYRFRVVAIEHGIAFYPVKIHNVTEGKYIEAFDEEDFKKQLKAILSSERTRSVIEALIAQSRATPAIE